MIKIMNTFVKDVMFT